VSSIAKSKEQLQQAIELTLQKILADYLTIPEDVARKIAVEGNVKGTQISVCDTVSYLIGWGKLVLKWHAQKSAGQSVDFPETGYQWNQLGKLAQSFHLQYQSWTYNDLLVELKSTIAEILCLIERLDDQQLYADHWYQQYTLGRMIQFNTSSPMKNMRIKIRKFKKINALK